MADTRLKELEEQVDALHKLAQEYNKTGRVDEATAAYKRMAALDDEALAITLSAPTPPTAAACKSHAAEHPEYSTCHQPQPWSEVAAAAVAGGSPGLVGGLKQRSRALGAVLSAVAADAAAMGVHWVYNTGMLAGWEAERAAQGAGLEFMEPPRNPFYEYPSGRASSYGEQTLVLLKSLVDAQGLDCRRYAAALAEAFGTGFDGYRDVSTKAFLRRYASGLLPPSTGAPSDQQANAFTRLPPLVALYAGDSRLPTLVECMIRTTQNNDEAVAYGLAAAAVLERLILGEPSPTAAVRSVAAALLGGAASKVQQQQQQQQQQGDGLEGNGLAARVGPELSAQVGNALQRVIELAALPPPAATAVLGRNCHLPTSLQTALHVLAHREGAQGAGVQQSGGAGHFASEARQNGRGAGEAPQHGAGPAERSSADADGAEAGFCLPCMLGGPGDGSGSAQCAWRPGAVANNAAGAAAAGAAAAAGSAAESPDTANQASAGTKAYVAAIRAALREGGCCASRAAYVGACLGALGGASVVPEGWEAKIANWEQTKELASSLCSLRD